MFLYATESWLHTTGCATGVFLGATGSWLHAIRFAFLAARDLRVDKFSPLFPYTLMYDANAFPDRRYSRRKTSSLFSSASIPSTLATTFNTLANSVLVLRFICLATNSSPSPAPHWAQINDPDPSLSSNRNRSLPPHQGQWLCLPVRNSEPTPIDPKISIHLPCARSLTSDASICRPPFQTALLDCTRKWRKV